MKRDDLETFRVVAEELSFTRAAERLNITVSSVSQRVRRLEEELGATLLARSTRHVHLTGDGMVVLDGAHQRAALDQRIHRAVTEPAGSIRTRSLGVSRVDVANLLDHLDRVRTDVGSPGPDRLDRWTIASFPEVPAALSALAAGDIEHLLWSDWNDLWLAGAPIHVTRRLQSEVIAEEPLWLHLAADHPAAVHDEIAWPDLADEAWVAPTDVHARQVLIRAIRTLGGFEPKIAFVTDDPRLSADVVRTRRAVDLGPPPAEPVPGVTARPVTAGPVARLRLSRLQGPATASHLHLSAGIRRWALGGRRPGPA